MPDTETTVAEPQKQSFADFRAARGTTPQAPIPLDDTPISRQNSAEEPKGESKPAAGSEPASGQRNKVEERKSEIQKEIDGLTARKHEAGREWQEFEDWKKSKKPADVPRETVAPQQNTAPATAAFDGTDTKDPRPERPKKPSENVDASGKPWGTWAEYNAAKDKYDDDIITYGSEDAAWVARREWRKQDAVKQQAAAIETAHVEQRQDFSEFVEAAHKWAKDEGAEDFDGLFAEVQKRPTLSVETGSLTIYGGADGARLLHHLMTNPATLEDIENEPPKKRLRSLLKLSHDLAREAYKGQARPAQEPRRTAAPPAGTRVTGSGGPSSRDPKSFTEFKLKRFGS